MVIVKMSALSGAVCTIALKHTEELQKRLRSDQKDPKGFQALSGLIDLPSGGIMNVHQ
jgi:hypothetical protein